MLKLGLWKGKVWNWLLAIHKKERAWVYYSSPFWLHKLGDKNHDDDDGNDKTKKEEPDLEKSLFPSSFIEMEFLHGKGLFEDVACKERKAEGSKWHEEIGNQEVHGVKEGFTKNVNIRHNSVR